MLTTKIFLKHKIRLNKNAVLQSIIYPKSDPKNDHDNNMHVIFLHRQDKQK